MPESATASQLSQSDRDVVYAFHAMATPCEARIETDDAALAGKAGRAVEAEARRIESKFSRYRSDSVVGQINTAEGRPIQVDPETAHLLDFAARCFDLSDGLFDITSGVLRRAWRFDGSDRLPESPAVEALRCMVGWNKVTWQPPMISLPAGMEIDLGGLAKEYAVDRALAVARALTSMHVLINFGGDLAVSGPRTDGVAWNVAIASVDREGDMAGMLELTGGALATSGDARRFLLRDG